LIDVSDEPDGENEEDEYSLFEYILFYFGIVKFMNVLSK
jgi:hypothetical protein